MSGGELEGEARGAEAEGAATCEAGVAGEEEGIGRGGSEAERKEGGVLAAIRS